MGAQQDLIELLEGIAVSRETIERLRIYESLLVKWQKKINLISRDSVDNLWRRHFLDALQLLQWVDRDKCILDMGAGAGFPGMALAIAGCRDAHLVESDGKKIAFLKEVARATQTSVHIHHQRIERVHIQAVDIITSRALAALPQLLGYASPHFSAECVAYFHKGKNYSKELLDSNKEWMFDYDVYPSRTNSEGVILAVKHLRKRGL